MGGGMMSGGGLSFSIDGRTFDPGRVRPSVAAESAEIVDAEFRLEGRNFGCDAVGIEW